MSTSDPGEIADFQAFLNAADAAGFETLDQAVSAFRERQSQFQRLRGEIQSALEESRRGESAEIDYDEVKRRCRERLGERGIYDS